MPFGLALKAGASAAANAQFAVHLKQASQLHDLLGHLDAAYRSLGLRFHLEIPVRRQYDLGAGPRQICEEAFVVVESITDDSTSRVSAHAEGQVLRDQKTTRKWLDEAKGALKGAANQISAVPAQAELRWELMWLAGDKMVPVKERLEMAGEDLVSLGLQVETLLEWLPPLWREGQTIEEKDLAATRLRAWGFRLPEVRHAIEALGFEEEDALELGLALKTPEMEERFLTPEEARVCEQSRW